MPRIAITPIGPLSIGKHSYEEGKPVTIEVTDAQLKHLAHHNPRVLDSTPHPLVAINRDELRDLARALDLPVGGTKAELLDVLPRISPDEAAALLEPETETEAPE